MDFANSSFLLPDYTYENELDFSSLLSPSTFISFQEPNPPNPIIHCAAMENQGRQRICEATMAGKITKQDDEPKNKRAKHREIEKHRRQEVTALFKNRRHILPFQYIKGKRSSSDHVLEAVNYIKDLEKKIKDNNEKRDRIKRSTISHSNSAGECYIRSLASSSSLPSLPSSLSSNCSCVGDTHIDVKISTCLVGMEIVASSCIGQGFCVSNLLQVVAQEQCINIVSCISTRLHQRFIHTIVSEVEEGKEVNFSELQEKIIKTGTSYVYGC